MTRSGTRRVVVIKDIPSNLVEEAILVLKTDKDFEITAPKGKEGMANDFLIKEAQSIIENYIYEIKRGEEYLRGRDRLRRLKYFSYAVNTVLIGSIMLFVYLMARLF